MNLRYIGMMKYIFYGFVIEIFTYLIIFINNHHEAALTTKNMLHYLKLIE